MQKKWYVQERDLRRIRVIAVVAGVLVHGLVIVGLMFRLDEVRINTPALDRLVFGGSGGGGGEGANDDLLQFGPQGETENEKATGSDDSLYQHNLHLVTIQVYDDADLLRPPPKKEEPTPAPPKKRPKPILAQDLPTRWIRKGTGPGSGGGAGGGSGGGIGPGQGYSLDWGGEGSRRLLSGKLPRYPEGTDKQMAVTLQFTVLPDGTVDAILPIRKTDERLEGSAITALRTWRFDPLPAQMEQKSQIGKVTFNFKLE